MQSSIDSTTRPLFVFVTYVCVLRSGFCVIIIRINFHRFHPFVSSAQHASVSIALYSFSGSVRPFVTTICSFLRRQKIDFVTRLSPFFANDGTKKRDFVLILTPTFLLIRSHFKFLRNVRIEANSPSGPMGAIINVWRGLI
jgi:hypothetical protein